MITSNWKKTALPLVFSHLTLSLMGSTKYSLIFCPFSAHRPIHSPLWQLWLRRRPRANVGLGRLLAELGALINATAY